MKTNVVCRDDQVNISYIKFQSEYDQRLPADSFRSLIAFMPTVVTVKQTAIVSRSVPYHST
jgi:hypothetical protein